MYTREISIHGLQLSAEKLLLPADLGQVAIETGQPWYSIVYRPAEKSVQ
jgi:hypothetical protein